MGRKKSSRADDPNKPMRQRRTKLDIEIIDTLREKNRELRKELENVKKTLLAEERATTGLQRRAVAAEREAEVLMDGLRVLAKGAPNTTYAGRQARKLARETLERAGVRPPNTLGRSRQASPRKKKTRNKSS